MRREVLLIVLLAVHGAFLERRWAAGGAGRMDALAPRAREVEHALRSERFDDALAIALELADVYPEEPLTTLWLAAIYRGLGRSADEAAAWERFIVVGSAPAEACPGLAEAYARMGDEERGLRAYERCVQLDPSEPERLIDLAEALERAGKPAAALAVYRRAADLDPKHPVVRRRVDQGR